MSHPFLLAQADGAWVRNGLWAPRMDCSRAELVLGYREPSVLAAAKAQLEELALSPHMSEAVLKAQDMLVERTVFEHARLTRTGDEALALALKVVAAERPGPVAHLCGGQEIVLPAGCVAVVVSMLGARLAPEGWMMDLAQAAREHGAWLIADERQTGLGRTGKLMAYQHEGLAPELVVLGEGLGGGVMSAGAVLGPASLERIPVEFAPSALAGVCAQATLERIRPLISESRAAATHLFVALRRLPGEVVQSLDVLGMLAVIALSPELGGAQRVAKKLTEAGLMLHPCGDNELMMCPPLLITTDELDWAVGHIHAVLWT